MRAADGGGERNASLFITAFSPRLVRPDSVPIAAAHRDALCVYRLCGVSIGSGEWCVADIASSALVLGV